MYIWSGIKNVESCFRKNTFPGGRGREGEGQNKTVDLLKWYWISKCASRKKRHFRGGVADMHLPWWWWLFLQHNVYVPENWKVIIRCSNLCIQASQGMFYQSTSTKLWNWNAGLAGFSARNYNVGGKLRRLTSRIRDVVWWREELVAR